MKRFIMAMVLATILSSLAGCFIVARDDRGEDHERHDWHEDRDEDRR
jgi:hypothetical protein